MDKTLLLEVKEVVKTFPGVKALDRVSFELRRGEVHALVGENGAGKSTLMNILGGVYQPDSGEVRLEGKAVRLSDPYAASKLGISLVFQELSISPNMSIAENIFANRQPVGKYGLVDFARLYEETERMLLLFDWQIDPRTPVRNLTAAKQQVVEILKAVSQNPRVLILDEPTSSLTALETEKLFENIRRLKSEGISFIYISHHLSEVFEIADRVTVFRDGKHVETCRTSDVTEDELVRRMVGRELVDMYGSRRDEIGEECFRLEGVTRTGEFYDVSFSVRKGEIVGIAGLAGSGRTELARAVFGVSPLDGGRVLLEGREVIIKSPGEAIRSRIAYLSEDRKEDGLFLGMTVRENCVAPSLPCFTGMGGLMDEKAISGFAETYRERFNVVTPSVDQRVGALSGGNQQKVLLAMWMGIKPLVLFADEPTRGVDVGAKSEIYHHLRELAATGVGIVLISSDLPEVLGLSDRVLVMRNGWIAGEYSGARATEENVIACAAGLAANCPEAHSGKDCREKQ